MSTRRRFLASLGVGAAGVIAGCGYRPGGGDVRWRETHGGLFDVDEVDAATSTIYVSEAFSMRHDFDADEWYGGVDIVAYDASTGDELWSEEFEGAESTSLATTEDVAVLAVDDALVRLDEAGVQERTEVGSVPLDLAIAGEHAFAITARRPSSSESVEPGEPIETGESTEPGTPAETGESTETGDSTETDDSTQTGDSTEAGEAPSSRHVAAVADGSVAWRRELETATESRRDPLLAAGPAGVLCRDGDALLALDSDGTRRFRRSDLDVVRTATAGPDAWYVTTDAAVLALEPTSGRTRWRYDATSVTGPCRRSSDGVYVQTGRGLVALDGTGERRWSYGELDYWETPGTFAVNESGVYAAGGAGLVALRPDDGDVRWELSYDRLSAGPFTVENGILVLVDRELIVHVP